MTRHLAVRWGFVLTLLGASLMIASPAAAQWDPAKLAETKNAAEQAYDAGDFGAAARSYIELRSMLKNALASGEVPADYLPSVEAALVAVAYQLGRSNQLSDNCQGAVSVYDELLESSAADATLLGRARVRVTESHLCLVEVALLAADYAQTGQELRAARQELTVLEAVLADPAAEPNDEVVQGAAEVRVSLEASERKVITTLIDDVARALERSECAAADVLLAQGSTLFAAQEAEPERWAGLQIKREDVCVKKVADAQAVEVAPADPEPQEEATEAPLNIWPWVIVGVGGATLVAAIVTDNIVSAEIDDYESTLGYCKNGDPVGCYEARQAYDDLSGKPEAVLALYVVGGAVVTGGLVWWAVDTFVATESSEVSVQVIPTRDGVRSSVGFTF